jgi:hypothetical protein
MAITHALRRLRTIVTALAVLAWLVPVHDVAPKARAAGCSSFDLPVDIKADALEITQGVQDGKNRIPLVDGKRTYVRLYAHILRPGEGGVFTTDSRLPVLGTSCVVDAKLTAQTGSRVVTLEPLDQDGVDTVTTARVDRFKRSEPGYGFLFELPSTATLSTTSLTAEVNPNGTINENRTNNVVHGTASFRVVPRIPLTIDRLSYFVGFVNHYDTSLAEAAQMVRWIQRAFPLPGVDWRSPSLEWGNTTVSGGSFTDLTCDDLNAARMTRDLGFPADENELIQLWTSNKRTYGMVDDAGGFMRGCASKVKITGDDRPGCEGEACDFELFGPFAAGPTGDPPNLAAFWDTDGSYGDWYGGHELSHTYGRRHVFCSGSEGGAGPWPYPGGLISPSSPDADAIVGFDIETQEVYGFNKGHDLMTYCDYQWTSDILYKYLLDFFGSSDPVPPPTGPTDDNICVIGTLGTKKEPDGQLQPIFHSGTPTLSLTHKAHGSSKYAIVQKGADGSVLGRQRFKPVKVSSGAPLGGQKVKDVRSLMVLRCLRFIPGTTAIEVTGPGKRVLGSIHPGTSSPTVEVFPPTTGATPSPSPTSTPIATATPSPTPTPPVFFGVPRAAAPASDGGTAFHLEWTASDPDGDALTHLVQVSYDGGQTWTTVTLPTTETSVDVPRANVTAGGVDVRVVTTDGLHTSVDVLDDLVFIDGDAPILQIRSPTQDQHVRSRTTLSLEAFAYDLDVGSLDSAVTWRSDRNGALGTGDQVSVTGLSPGNHVITAEAKGVSGTSIVTVPIVVE